MPEGTILPNPNVPKTPTVPNGPKPGAESAVTDPRVSKLLTRLEGQMDVSDDRSILETLAAATELVPTQTADILPDASTGSVVESQIKPKDKTTPPTETAKPEAPTNTVIDTEKPLSAQMQEHLARLKPESITTDDGVERTVFTFQHGDKPIKVIFYPPNELPVSETYFTGKRLHVIGDKPGWRTDKDWNTYVNKLQKLDASTARRPGEDLLNPTNFYYDDAAERERPEMLMLVEQNPRALIDLVMATATSDTRDLGKTRKLLAEHKTNPEIDDTLDAIIASKILDDDGQYKNSDPSDTAGEALTVLALNGDKEAQGYLDLKQRQLTEYDNAHNIVDSNQPLELDPSDRAALNRLSTIHVTRYLPQESVDGNYWDVHTRFDADQNIRVPRLTWHTTLQKRTGENAMAIGSTRFAGTPYALITRFGSLVEANGKPLSLSADDTFFEISPGRRVKIPKKDAVLVRPGNPNQRGELFERRTEQHEVVYKHAGFTSRDIQQIYGTKEEYNDDEKLKKAFVESMRGKDSQFEIPDEDAQSIIEGLGGRMYYQNGYPQVDFQRHLQTDESKLLGKLESTPLSDVVEVYFPTSRFPGPLGDTLRARSTQMLEGIIGSKVKDAAMESVVEEFKEGYDITSDANLGNALKRLDIPDQGTAGHWNSSSGLNEEGIMRDLGSFLEGRTSQSDYHATQLNISTLTPAMRKMYYYLGLL